MTNRLMKVIEDVHHLGVHHEGDDLAVGVQDGVGRNVPEIDSKVRYNDARRCFVL